MKVQPADYIFLNKPSPALLRQVIAIYKAEGWFEKGDTPARYRRIISGSYCFAVALLDGKAVGMARAISDGASDAYIQDVAVLRAFRRRGIALGLIRFITGKLSKDGLGWIGLIASDGADPLYVKCGFRPMPASVPMKFRGHRR